MATAYVYNHTFGLTKDDFFGLKNMVRVFREANGVVGFKLRYRLVMGEDPEWELIVIVQSESERWHNWTLEEWIAKTIDLFAEFFLPLSILGGLVLLAVFSR